MKVKMLQSQAGVDFVRNRGEVVDLPDSEAARLVAAGIAEPVRTEPIEKAYRPPRGEKATA